ncbi:hypothetical protein [Methylocystis parvus]|nr:hypothetical protein [Methylocystis parvus]WBK02185.1 hypothetical protein MMG94_20285 [Methylocystis parvus OBBP]
MKIAHLFDDPTVRAMLEAAERDEGEQSYVPARQPEPLLGSFAEGGGILR